MGRRGLGPFWRKWKMTKQSSGYGWVVTFSGTAINLALGALYSWSVFKKPLEAAFNLNDKQSALPYSVACIIFALMMVPAGRLQDKIGPRVVASLCGVLVAIGFFIASMAMPGNALSVLVIGFGVLAGAGIGFGYASATPPAVKWFHASKKGLIVGLVVGGFGLASVYVAPLTTKLINTKAPPPAKVVAKVVAAPVDPTNIQIVKLKTYMKDPAAGKAAAAAKAGAAKKAKADDEVKSFKLACEAEADPTACLDKKMREAAAAKAKAIEQFQAAIKFAFKTLAIIFGIAVILFAQFLKNPPEGYKPAAPAGVSNPGNPAASNPGKKDYSSGEMLGTYQFWVIWIMYVFASGAGLMVISFLAKMAKELSDAGKLGIAGFAFVAILAIGNAGGRVIAGTMSDRIGRTRTMLIVFLLQALVLCVFPSLSGTAAFAIGSLLIGFNYGACLSVFPSITADYYGLKNLGLNYGLVFTAWGVGGLILPTYIAGTIKVATGYYTLAFYAAAILCLVAAAMSFMVKPPTPRISKLQPLVDLPPMVNSKPPARKA